MTAMIRVAISIMMLCVFLNMVHCPPPAAKGKTTTCVNGKMKKASVCYKAPTCANPSPKLNGSNCKTLSKKEKCVCNKGYVVRYGKCILFKQCNKPSTRPKSKEAGHMMDKHPDYSKTKPVGTEGAEGGESKEGESKEGETPTVGHKMDPHPELDPNKPPDFEGVDSGSNTPVVHQYSKESEANDNKPGSKQGGGDESYH